MKTFEILTIAILVFLLDAGLRAVATRFTPTSCEITYPEKVNH